MAATSPIDTPTACILLIASVGVVAWGVLWGLATLRGWEQQQQQQQHEVTWWPPADTFRPKSRLDPGPFL